MNSNHQTLCSRYEGKNKMECYTGKITITQRKKARTATSMIHESLKKNSHAFILVFKNNKTDMFSTNYFLSMGSNLHLIKRYKYID